MSLIDEFIDDDLVVILEVARVALNTDGVMAMIGTEMDLSDDELVKLRSKLEGVMNEHKCVRSKGEAAGSPAGPTGSG